MLTLVGPYIAMNDGDFSLFPIKEDDKNSRLIYKTEELDKTFK